MAVSKKTTVGERLFWCYANLAMSEMAVHERCAAYERKHFMVRARLYKGLMTGSMSPRSLMRDQAIRMKLPQECVYCGATERLSMDHIVASSRGGDDTGDNAIWACRRCNSSKSDSDLFKWWGSTRTGLPPLFVIRIYLKQAIRFFESRDLLSADWRGISASPFDLSFLPENFPGPDELTFSPHHEREARTNAQQEEVGDRKAPDQDGI